MAQPLAINSRPSIANLGKFSKGIRETLFNSIIFARFYQASLFEPSHKYTCEAQKAFYKREHL